MVEWYGDARSPTPNRDQLEVAMIARRHHKTWLDNLTHIDVDMVEQLYMPIKTSVEGEITLHQVLISIRSKSNYACNIFQAVNQNAVTGIITALCHSGYEEEANEIMMNLVTLCKERFGKKTKFWFTQEALEESKEQVYNRTTNTVDIDETKLKAKTDIFAVFGDHATEAARLNAAMTGAIIPEYYGGFDSDTDSDDEDEPRQKPKFDLKMLFNLRPSLSGAGGMDDQNSIGTNATGTSNVTQLILNGGIDVRFDSINIDGDSVNSSLTGPTKNTPPHPPRQVAANSNEMEETTKMDQDEQQEGEPNMEVENEGTKKCNKEKKQTDPEAGMANGEDSNAYEGEDRNMEDIDDGSEEGEQRNDKEGGGKAGGRGGDILDDKRGRGGNYSLGAIGSVINTSQTNITTIVNYNNDNTAQSTGEDEQNPTANGKSDNVSTSPQQTGAAEDAAG